MKQFQQAFPAFCDNEGRIFSQQTYQSTQQIGWTIEKYNELEKIATDAINKAEEYKKKLIEAGIIKPVLTTEEQIAELTKQVSLLSQQNASLSEQMNTLTELLTSPNNLNKKENS